MKKYILYIMLFLAGMISHLQAQKSVNFFEEHIDFVLDSAYFSINGIYSFHNESGQPVNEHIVFPFADKTGGIDSIRIVNLNTFEKVPFTRLESSVAFEFNMQPNDTVDLNIFYRQKSSTRNTYIITSTQTWGKSLDTAVYSLTTPAGLPLVSFTYTPDSVIKDHDKRVYKWEMHQFMPVKDFEIMTEK